MLSNDVEQSLRAVLESAISWCLRVDQEITKPVRISWRVSISDRIAQFREEMTSDNSSLVWNVINLLSRQKPFLTLESCLESDPLIGPQINKLIGTRIGMRRFTTKELLQGALAYYLAHARSDLEFDDEAFMKICSEFDEFFAATKLKFTHWAVLHNFRTETELIELTPSMRIHRFAAGEVENLWNTDSFFQLLYPFNRMASFPPLEFDAYIERTTQWEKIVGEQESSQQVPPGEAVFDPTAEFGKVITALRILKPGAVLLGIVQTKSSGLQGMLGGAMFGVSPPARDLAGNRPTCNLLQSDIVEFQRIWQIIEQGVLEKDKSFQVAVGRLSLAADREKPEDALIDVIIALEALLLSDTQQPPERGELRFRLSLRLAQLLGGDRQGMIRHFRTARKAYDLRSVVVHGGDTTTLDQELAVDAMDLCRQAIRKVLDLSAENTRPDWEALLFGPLSNESSDSAEQGS